MEQRLRVIFERNGYPIIEGEENVQLRLDSLQFISIMCDVENEFEVAVPDELLTGKDLDTFNDILEAVRELCK